jgi:putative FmdB family regulatory protein
MPLYEYECDANGHRFEVIQKFSDPPVEKCPTCGSSVHKLIASPAIQFKGSGWYITDYARKDSAGAGKSAGAKEGGAKESGSETKAASSSSETTSPSAAPAKKD